MNRVALGFVLASCVGCGAETEPATQVIVLVGGDPRIDALQIRVRSESALQFVEDRQITLPRIDSEGRRLPTSFTIVPNARDPADRFRIDIVGFETRESVGIPFVRRIAIGTFSSGRTTLLPIALTTVCANEKCGCEWADAACSQTCEPPSLAESTRCVAVPIYPKLAEVEPGEEREALARGVGGCKRGERLDAKGQCADLDECTFGLDNCDHAPLACENEVAGEYPFACHCPRGYTGEGEGPNGCR